MASVVEKAETKVADEVWIITALLHREHPESLDFSVEEIVARARQEHIVEPLRPGFYVHAVQHCVANRPPNPGRYRMLFETSPSRRRLYRLGDSYHAEREGSKITPAREALPVAYRGLLSWYRDWADSISSSAQPDPLLQLRESGKTLWANEDADSYVRRLREGWE